MDPTQHVPVMVEEVLADLDLRPGATVVDGTIGLAGHSARIAELISPGGRIIGFDWDEAMLTRARERMRAFDEIETTLYHADYRRIPAELEALGTRPDGILLDLGLNNAQIEDTKRGISFRTEAPLDMRMDRSRSEPVSELIDELSVSELERILRVYGDERWSKRIAEVIVDRRPLSTTTDLVNCVLAAIPATKRDRRIHPATRTFQALRIYVNRELDELGAAIREIARCLGESGTIAVLAYHSGEDREVKQAFRELGREPAFQELHRKPLTPTEEEVAHNPKSRSAKLRALRRSKEA